MLEKLTQMPLFCPTAKKSAINALDPSLTSDLCVVCRHAKTPTRVHGLYNIEEAIDDNLVLHSTVSLQTIAFMAIGRLWCNMLFWKNVFNQMGDRSIQTNNTRMARLKQRECICFPVTGIGESGRKQRREK